MDIKDKNMTLEDILELIKSSATKDSKLYFVTRGVKPGVAKHSRLRDKYLFKVFTYPIQNKVFSFSDVVTNQLQKVTDKITSIANITTDEEELWAYCLEFYCTDGNKKIFTFRKILPSKVGIDEKAKICLKKN